MDSANPETGQQAQAAKTAAPGSARRGTFAIPAAPPVRTARPPHDRMWWRQTARGLLRAPASRDTRRQAGYAVAGLLLAVPGFAFIVAGVTVGFGLSLSFAGMLVGLPLLMVTLLGARGLGTAHRHLAGRCWDCRSCHRLRRARSQAVWARPGRCWPIRPAGGRAVTCCSSCRSRHSP